MKILTVENEVYEIDPVSDEVDDIRFGVSILVIRVDGLLFFT